jgi:hypothetical protein
MDGGISSQMHQYLLGRIFCEKGYKVEYDLRWFIKHGKDMNAVFERNFDLEKAFPELDFAVANSLESKLYSRFFATKTNCFDHQNEDVFLYNLTPPKYLGGYYHSPKDVWTNLFSKYFSVNPQVLPDEQRKLFDEMSQNKQSVAIHVRMGDLKNYTVAYGHPVSSDYFQKAIDYIREKIEEPYFYFFSDEPELLEKELLEKITVCSNSYRIVDFNGSDKGYLDLFLIAGCSHQITSKGSLGKLGAMLNCSSEKIVVLCDDPTEYAWKERLVNSVIL